MDKNKKRNLMFLSSPVFFGVILGILAVLAQPIFKIQPPQAYGICTVCHARDLLNWLSKLLFSFELGSAEASMTLPLLTTLGIFMGSFISSKLNGEFRFIKTANNLKMLIYGILVSNFALIIVSCPTRLVLRFAYGDPLALIAIAGLLVGIFIGVIFIKRSF